MPADGRRKKIIAAVATAAATPNGGSDYFFTLTNAVVKSKQELETRLMTTGGVAIEVVDVGDRHVIREAQGGVQATMTVKVRATIRDAAQNLVDRVQDLAADLTLAFGRSVGAGGQSTGILLDGFDETFYDYAKEFAVLVARIKCTYEYDLGVDR